MNNLTIKIKLHGLAILVVVCLTILSVVALRSFSSMKRLNETLLLVEVNKSNMLTLRRNEKDFLARLDSKYQQKFKQVFIVLMNGINRIKNNIENIGLDREQEQEQEQELSDLIKYLRVYRASFNKIVTLNQKIGLNVAAGVNPPLFAAT